MNSVAPLPLRRSLWVTEDRSSTQQQGPGATPGCDATQQDTCAGQVCGPTISSLNHQSQGLLLHPTRQPPLPSTPLCNKPCNQDVLEDADLRYRPGMNIYNRAAAQVAAAVAAAAPAAAPTMAAAAAAAAQTGSEAVSDMLHQAGAPAPPEAPPAAAAAAAAVVAASQTGSEAGAGQADAAARPGAPPPADVVAAAVHHVIPRAPADSAPPGGLWLQALRHSGQAAVTPASRQSAGHASHQRTEHICTKGRCGAAASSCLRSQECKGAIR